MTLEGHPERGMEWFLLDRGPDGRITFTVAAVSTHASRLARLGGPATTKIQHLVTTAYLRAPDRL